MAKYLLHNLAGLANPFKKLLFDDDKQLAERFLSQILKNSRMYSQSDYENLRRTRGYE